jgi:hypothetical protein
MASWAVGFKNGYLFRTVLEQSMVTGVLGFAIGVGLTLAFRPLPPTWSRSS